MAWFIGSTHSWHLQDSVGYICKICHYWVIQHHWSYFVILHFKVWDAGIIYMPWGYIMCTKEAQLLDVARLRWICCSPESRPYSLVCISDSHFTNNHQVDGHLLQTVLLWNKVLQHKSSDSELLCSDILSNDDLQNFC